MEGGEIMSENYIDVYKDSINRSIEYFAIDFFKDTDLEYLLEPKEDVLAYVDGLYLKDEIQHLYLFSDEKIRLVTISLENGDKVIKSTFWKVENLKTISLTQRGYNVTVMIIEFNDDDKITLDTNNVFGHWMTKASKRLKEIYKKYY